MKQVDGNHLKGEDTLTYKKLKEMLQYVIDGYKWRHFGAYNVVNFLENTPVDWSRFVVDSTRFDSEADFRNYLARLCVCIFKLLMSLHLPFILPLINTQKFSMQNNGLKTWRIVSISLMRTPSKRQTNRYNIFHLGFSFLLNYRNIWVFFRVYHSRSKNR